MFRNSDRHVITQDLGRGHEAGDGARKAEPGRKKWPRRHSDSRPQVTAYQIAICPQCRLLIRDEIAINAGYCARCRDFTLMCAAGRRLVSPDVTTRTAWHWPCTAIGTARWQVTRPSGAELVVLCPVHDSELAAGRISWIVQPVFVGAAWTTAR